MARQKVELSLFSDMLHAGKMGSQEQGGKCEEGGRTLEV